MIGIIGAMEVEVRRLLSELDAARQLRISGRDFYSGRLRGQEAVVVQGGIGKVNAALCAEAMILRFEPSLLINTGVAGALSPRLHIGDIAVARDLVQHDVDTTAFGDPIGMVPTVNRVSFPCAPWAVQGLLDAVAAQEGVAGVAARIATGDQFISDTAVKRKIVRDLDADVCEMEGCAIAQVCYVNGVDCAVIRAISDATDGGHVDDYARFRDTSAELSANILLKFMESLR